MFKKKEEWIFPSDLNFHFSKKHGNSGLVNTLTISPQQIQDHCAMKECVLLLTMVNSQRNSAFTIHATQQIFKISNTMPYFIGEIGDKGAEYFTYHEILYDAKSLIFTLTSYGSDCDMFVSIGDQLPTPEKYDFKSVNTGFD